MAPLSFAYPLWALQQAIPWQMHTSNDIAKALPNSWSSLSTLKAINASHKESTQEIAPSQARSMASACQSNWKQWEHLLLWWSCLLLKANCNEGLGCERRQDSISRSKQTRFRCNCCRCCNQHVRRSSWSHDSTRSHQQRVFPRIFAVMERTHSRSNQAPPWQPCLSSL